MGNLPANVSISTYNTFIPAVGGPGACQARCWARHPRVFNPCAPRSGRSLFEMRDPTSTRNSEVAKPSLHPPCSELCPGDTALPEKLPTGAVLKAWGHPEKELGSGWWEGLTSTRSYSESIHEHTVVLPVGARCDLALFPGSALRWL